MLKKIIALVILAGIGYGSYSLWASYKGYQLEKQARIERLQAQAEEVKVTTIEGWNIAKIGSELDKIGLMSPEDFKQALDDFDISSYSLISKPNNASLEGYLFPDTYRFTKTSTPEMVISKMLDNFTVRVESLGIRDVSSPIVTPGFENLVVVGGDGEAGMSLYDVLVLASIVELESGGKASSEYTLAEERALIAGVFFNRLTIGQALQSDATVNYVTGKSTPGASLADLEVNSPYNTYKYPGLPPGPIANPSLGSIRAVLNPTKSDFFFFLHKQPSGEVMFSKTFEEHSSKR